MSVCVLCGEKRVTIACGRQKGRGADSQEAETKKGVGEGGGTGRQRGKERVGWRDSYGGGGGLKRNNKAYSGWEFCN